MSSGLKFHDAIIVGRERTVQVRNVNVGILHLLKPCAQRICSSVPIKNTSNCETDMAGLNLRSLLRLEELDIYNCGMEEIVSEEGEAKAAARFVFPHLTWSHLMCELHESEHINFPETLGTTQT
ncbi:hypothetical protein QYF36_003866 [Acer negundo]|nr:hypothetical protein QYF36_003866 [Acer negundo]